LEPWAKHLFMRIAEEVCAPLKLHITD